MTAILEHEVRATGEMRPTGMRRHLFTRDEYYAMAETAPFRDKRIELIEGEIIEMAPIGDPHAAVTDPIAEALRVVFGFGFTVRSQVPIALGANVKPSDPQPDVTVVTGSWRDYVARKPGPADIKLVVEVADSSLIADRTVKSRLYASAGIPEYWIVNLIDRQLEVFREPGETGYASSTIHTAAERVEPLSTPGQSLSVADFLP